MSKATIQRALALAKEGLPDEGLEILRPLMLNDALKPFALTAQAFCHEKKGDFSRAKYLYTEAIKRQPDSVDWMPQLRRCEDAFQSTVKEIKQQRPHLLFLLIISSLLFILAAFCFAVAFPGPPADIFELTFDIQSAENPTLFCTFGGMCAFLCIMLLIVAWKKKASYKHALKVAMGDNFSDKRHITCWACELKFFKSLPSCPHCGSPKKQPKEKKPHIADDYVPEQPQPGQSHYPPSQPFNAPPPSTGTPIAVPPQSTSNPPASYEFASPSPLQHPQPESNPSQIPGPESPDVPPPPPPAANMPPPPPQTQSGVAPIPNPYTTPPLPASLPGYETAYRPSDMQLDNKTVHYFIGFIAALVGSFLPFMSVMGFSGTLWEVAAHSKGHLLQVAYTILFCVSGIAAFVPRLWGTKFASIKGLTEPRWLACLISGLGLCALQVIVVGSLLREGAPFDTILELLDYGYWVLLGAGVWMAISGLGMKDMHDALKRDR